MKLILENWNDFLNEQAFDPPEDLTKFSMYLNDKIRAFLLDSKTVKELQSAQTGEEFSIILDKGELFSDYQTLNDVYIAVTINDENSAHIGAYYLCVPEDRSQSNLVIEVDIPRNYAKIEGFEEWLDVDLEDALSHELQHSCDPTDMLGSDIPEGEEKWESLENIYKHFASEAEIRGHLAGTKGRIRAMRRRGYDIDIESVVADKVNTIYEDAISRGYEADELGPVMQTIWQEWTNYLKGSS